MKRKTIFIFLFVFYLIGIQLLAKETGNIKGQITDEEGNNLPGVEITAESPSLQGTRSVISSETGHFYFSLLPVGNYTITFQLDGFNSVIQKDVIVRLGITNNINIVMELSKLEEEIVVSAEPPLLDKSSTDTSFHLTDEDLEKIPSQDKTVVDVVKITPGVTGIRANTRKGSGSGGQPSFRGEGAEGNNWIVDGLPISGVRLKYSGMYLNYDSIKQIQIISDPFSPEYGSAYGGIINIVTKSGGNEFSGEFSLDFMDKNFQAQREEQLSIVSEPSYFSNYNWYFNFGGPLIKDKLWFFISDNLFLDKAQTEDQTLDYLSIPGSKKTSSINNLFTKISYAINNKHNLSLTSIYNTSLGQKGGIGIKELYEQEDFTDIIYRINYKGILSSSTFIEAGFGQVNRNSFIEPLDKDLGPAMYYIEDLACNIHNSYGNVTDDQNRLDFSFKFTKHIETDAFGRHEIGAGFEFYKCSSTFAVDFTGKDEDIFPDNGFDNGTKYYFDTWKNNKGTPTFFYEYGGFDFLNSTKGIGIYLKDKINWKWITFMAGFRSQTQLCLDNNGDKLWSWNLDDFFSPRLSLSLDITGNEKNVIKLGWGKFSDLITTMPLGLLNSGAGLTFRTYRWNGPEEPSKSQIHDSSNWIFENEQKNQPFEIAENIKPNFLTRYLIEYDRRLGKNWVFKARYVQTQAEDLLEVLAVFDIETDYKFLYDNFEHKRRNYHGIELELLGNIGEYFYFNASYCHSSAKGTNPGQSETGSWSQEEGSTNYLGLFGSHIYIPDIQGLKEIKDYYDWALGGLGGRGIGDEGWYGKLPYSVDHNIKINSVFIVSRYATIYAAFEWISGYYWEKLGYVPFFGGFYSFPEGRGTKETPSHCYLDIAVLKEIKFPGVIPNKNLSLTIRLDIYNLFNSQKPISFVKEDINIFGSIWGRQQPRQAKLSMKIKW
ncbi:MAG: TonB-dependent receptor [Candidatus Aminicenantaceae bacterium]